MLRAGRIPPIPSQTNNQHHTYHVCRRRAQVEHVGTGPSWLFQTLLEAWTVWRSKGSRESMDAENGLEVGEAVGSGVCLLSDTLPSASTLH